MFRVCQEFFLSNPCFMSGLNNEEYQVVIGNDTTHYIIDDLEPASNYTFYIVAYMPLGASQMSDHVTQHTLEDGKTNSTDLGGHWYLQGIEMWDPVLTALEDPMFPLTSVTPLDTHRVSVSQLMSNESKPAFWEGSIVCCVVSFSPLRDVSLNHYVTALDLYELPRRWELGGGLGFISVTLGLLKRESNHTPTASFAGNFGIKIYHTTEKLNSFFCCCLPIFCVCVLVSRIKISIDLFLCSDLTKLSVMAITSSSV